LNITTVLHCDRYNALLLLLTSAFQLFTSKLCLQFSGLRMRNFTWNRFPIKNLLIDSLLPPIVESTLLNMLTMPTVMYEQLMPTDYRTAL